MPGHDRNVREVSSPLNGSTAQAASSPRRARSTLLMRHQFRWPQRAAQTLGPPREAALSDPRYSREVRGQSSGALSRNLDLTRDPDPLTTERFRETEPSFFTNSNGYLTRGFVSSEPYVGDVVSGMLLRSATAAFSVTR